LPDCGYLLIERAGYVIPRQRVGAAPLPGVRRTHPRHLVLALLLLLQGAVARRRGALRRRDVRPLVTGRHPARRLSGAVLVSDATMRFSSPRATGTSRVVREPRDGSRLPRCSTGVAHQGRRDDPALMCSSSAARSISTRPVALYVPEFQTPAITVRPAAHAHVRLAGRHPPTPHSCAARQRGADAAGDGPKRRACRPARGSCTVVKRDLLAKVIR